MRQGGQISPQILTVRIQGVFKDAQLEEKEINMDGGKLSDLRFADDVALTTDGFKDREHQLNTVNEESLKTGLMTHKGKSIILTNIDKTDNLPTDGTEIEKVTNYKYFRQTIPIVCWLLNFRVVC